MKIEQKFYETKTGWNDLKDFDGQYIPQLVLAFAQRKMAEDKKLFEAIKDIYPKSNILMCSTAGEIIDTKVKDGSVSLTAIYFEKATLQFAEVDIEKSEDSLKVGKQLADSISKVGLVHAMIFSDGLNVNGTELAKALNEHLPESVTVTGGLVGDGPDFKTTAVGLNHPGMQHKAVVVGFYGNNLKVGFGSLGGWDAFGVERTVTKSNGNTLFELDGQPALTLYKEYLGSKASELPSSALLFPLKLKTDTDAEDAEMVRTILSVDEKKQSMTFAGDIPQGAMVTLMKANFERLIDGASKAGGFSIEALGNQEAELAILISCVGRKLVLKERTEEEVEAVRSVIGKNATICGFYSYGEICPTAASKKQCLLHNQTMTITTFREI